MAQSSSDAREFDILQLDVHGVVGDWFAGDAFRQVGNGVRVVIYANGVLKKLFSFRLNLDKNMSRLRWRVDDMANT